MELGLQTIHEKTADFIGRGYNLAVFEDAYRRLKEAGLTVIVHVILGLPRETKEMMLETVCYLGNLPIDGIKLQLLHVLKGTRLAKLYEKEPFPILSGRIYGPSDKLYCLSPAVCSDSSNQWRWTKIYSTRAQMECK